MKIRLIERRMLFWPTVWGWLGLLLLIGSPVGWWVLAGEAFFRYNDRLPAEVLIIEGFVHDEGVRAAKVEFERGPYRYVVTSGTLTPGHGGPEKWNYAIEAHDLLLRLGVSPDKVIAAPRSKPRRNEHLRRQQPFGGPWTSAAFTRPPSISSLSVPTHGEAG